MNIIKLTLRTLSLIGALIFLAGFIMTFASQAYMEKHARNYIESEVREVVSDRLDAMRDKGKNALLSALSSQYEERIDQLESELALGLDERLNSIFALMGDPSCECRRWIERSHREGLERELLVERDKAEVVKTLIMAGYGEVVDNLRADFRIFTSSSFMAFLVVLLATFLKPAATAHLLFPSGLLIPSTLIAAWFYLFEQNWFYTILTNSYVGYGYTAWLLLIYGFLMDVIFNRARITTKIINGMMQSVGSAFSLVPC